MLTDTDLAAIRSANEHLKGRLVVAGEGNLILTWDAAADCVERTDKLLAEIDRLRDEIDQLNREWRETIDR